MKKYLGMMLMLAMIFPVLAIQAQDEIVTVTWWATERGSDTAATRDLHFELARAFEAENPDIQVAVTLYPSRGFANRVFAAIAAGEGPDVWYHYYATDIATQGFLEDLTPYVEESGIADQWFPSARQRGVYDGRFYGVPRDAVSGLVFYNKDIFDAAGVPYPENDWTVSEFRELANQFTDIENDMYGAGAIVGGEGCMLWSPFSFNLGGEITSPDGRDVVGYMDSEETIAAYQWCLEMVTEDQVATPASMMDQFGELTFLSGQVAMQSLSDWEIVNMETDADFNWGVVAAPRLDDSTDAVSWVDSYVYYLSADSNNKDEAWRLIEWLSGPDGQRMAAEAGIWSPNGPAIWEELGWDTDPIKGVSYQQLVNSDGRSPNYLRSQFFWDCAYGPFTDVRVLWVESGERDIAPLLADAAQTAQACLDENYAAIDG